MIFDYPNTDFNQINLDWLLDEDRKQNDKLNTLDTRVTALESGGTSSQEEIFYCAYGTTTNAEIEAALSNDMIPVCVYNNRLYILSSRVNSTYHVFFSGDQVQTRQLIVSGNIWSNNSVAYCQLFKSVSTPACYTRNCKYGCIQFFWNIKH